MDGLLPRRSASLPCPLLQRPIGSTSSHHSEHNFSLHSVNSDVTLEASFSSFAGCGEEDDLGDSLPQQHIFPPIASQNLLGSMPHLESFVASSSSDFDWGQDESELDHSDPVQEPRQRQQQQQQQRSDSVPTKPVRRGSLQDDMSPDSKRADDGSVTRETMKRRLDCIRKAAFTTPVA